MSRSREVEWKKYRITTLPVILVFEKLSKASVGHYKIIIYEYKPIDMISTGYGNSSAEIVTGLKMGV